MLAEQTPAYFIAFDLLALGDDDYTGRPFSERRAALVDALAGSGPSIHVTPVGVIGAFPMAKRRRLFTEFQSLVTTFDEHPWNWAAHMSGERTPRRNEGSRWNAGKDLSFVPLRPERVVEVRYDHMKANGSATPPSSTAGGPTATRAHAPTRNSTTR